MSLGGGSPPSPPPPHAESASRRIRRGNPAMRPRRDIPRTLGDAPARLTTSAHGEPRRRLPYHLLSECCALWDPFGSDGGAQGVGQEPSCPVCEPGTCQESRM